MEIEFQVNYIFENVTRRGPHLMARMLTENGDFKLTETLTLDGYRIKRFNKPRSLDEQGNPRFDIFTFDLKDKSELSNFEKGQIVKLIER